MVPGICEPSRVRSYFGMHEIVEMEDGLVRVTARES